MSAVSRAVWLSQQKASSLLTTACTKNEAMSTLAPEPLLRVSKAFPAAFHAQINAGTSPTKRHNATICGVGSRNGTKE
jgi:hypothetical protein